jgi:DNA topoisomerase III
MSLSLVIAEKPSVAASIARALKGFKRDGDFWVRDDMIIGSAVGHLLEISAPEEFDVKRGRWTFKNLPVLPPYFDLKPIKQSEDKLKSLAKMLRSRKVTDVINACDAGREGELIFRYIMQYCKCKKPVRRLWLQSMTNKSICDAFKQLRSDEEMKPLEAAARCRSEADWLVGINGTRAMTAFNSKDGGFFLTTVGRVQTPTLAIVVDRENEINGFKAKNYWEVSARFRCEDGTYEGLWQDPDFKKDEEHPEFKPERLWSEEKARAVADACRGGTGTVEETTKLVPVYSQQLFSLVTLQSYAFRRFGFTAKTTASICQALYEKHKALSYPRTEAVTLPEDYMPTVRETLGVLDGTDEYRGLAGKVLANSWVKPDKRVFDNSKITDHFALIPTGQIPKTLTDAERKIFDAVVRRFLAVFYPPAKYNVTNRTTTVGTHRFKTSGRTLVSAGWLEVEGRSAEDAQNELARVRPGEKVSAEDVVVSAKSTTPPPRYNEATLLSAMRKAGQKLEDRDLKAAMGNGLGTAATRAAIIEGLIEQKYMRREKGTLYPTAKAFQLISLLKGLKIAELSEPRLTAEWEQKLHMIEEGKAPSDEFMHDIRTMTENIVDAAKRYEGDSVPIQNPIHIKAPCPVCGGEVVETYRRFACTNPKCGFSITKHPSGRVLEPADVEELLSKGRVGPLSGFISKRGFPFEAELVLKKDENGELRMQFDFGEEERRPETAEEDVRNAETVGTCPVCGGRVLALPTAYQCEHNVRGDKKCTFRVSRSILSREIKPEEIRELLEKKRTPLLSGFVSKRSHRSFKAYLVLKAKGAVGFEFEPRAADAEGRKKPARRTAAKKGSAE